MQARVSSLSGHIAVFLKCRIMFSLLTKYRCCLPVSSSGLFLYLQDEWPLLFIMSVGHLPSLNDVGPVSMASVIYIYTVEPL